MKAVSRTLRLRPGEPDPNLDRVRRKDSKSVPPLTAEPSPRNLKHVRGNDQGKGVPRSEREHRSSTTLHLSWNVCPACRLRSFRHKLKIQLMKGKSLGGPTRSPTLSSFPSGVQNGWIDPGRFGRCDSASHQNGTPRIHVSGDFKWEGWHGGGPTF